MSDVQPLPLDLPAGPQLTHRLFRFPGKLHPPLVSFLLKEHQETRAVSDPMCGSGTVGVEVSASGGTGLCVDLDPLSCLMTSAKCTPVSPSNLTETGLQVLDTAQPLPKKDSVTANEALSAVASLLSGTSFGVPANLFHWFEPHVAVGIALLLHAVEQTVPGRPAPLRQALLAVIASIIRRLSRADPQPVSGLEVTRVRLRALENGLAFDVAREFRRNMTLLAKGYRQLLARDRIGKIKVVLGDVRRFENICRRAGFRPSLVITSPAYCNAIEYWRRHKLENQWLGFMTADAVPEFSRAFIGSTTIRQEALRDVREPDHPLVRRVTMEIERKGHPRKANLLRKYFVDMEHILGGIKAAMERGGIFYLVVGASISYGVAVDTPAILADLAEVSGFRSTTRVRYGVINRKMQFPTNNGSGIKTEHLLGFRAD